MALYAIGDLHLSLNGKKSMDIFSGWEDYINRIQVNWHKLISADDTVVLCGDSSWAMKMHDDIDDFSFIDALPGKKIILKGNHDYWWSTLHKMNTFCEEQGFQSISFLNNNAYVYKQYAICGTRSWFFDLEDAGDEKVFARELGRLKSSLEAADNSLQRIAFLHYPPIYQNQVTNEIIDLLKEYDVKECYYGHLHGKTCNYAFQGDYEGISFKLISADFLNFTPYFIKE